MLVYGHNPTIVECKCIRHIILDIFISAIIQPLWNVNTNTTTKEAIKFMAIIQPLWNVNKSI